MPFYKSYSPPAALAAIIREAEVYHAGWNKEDNLPEPFITCLANRDQALYFYINDPVKVISAAGVEMTAPPVVVTGPKSKPVGLVFGKDHLMVKVGFYPTGTYRLLGISMRQTINTGLDATAFWGNETQKVLKELKSMTSYDAMIDTVFAFIESKFDHRCRREEPIDQVAIRMLDPLNECSPEEWAAAACLSLRQFERNFITRVGISPKLFLRIVRFEYAMKIKNDFPAKSWAEVALQSGYTDSSHLLKEFKEFAAFPPSRFYLQPTSGYSDFPTG